MLRFWLEKKHRFFNRIKDNALVIFQKHFFSKKRLFTALHVAKIISEHVDEGMRKPLPWLAYVFANISSYSQANKDTGGYTILII